MRVSQVNLSLADLQAKSMIDVSYLCHWIKWEGSFILLLPTIIINTRLLIWEKKEEREEKQEKKK